MTELLVIAQEFGLPGIVVLFCTLVLIKNKDKVSKSKCSENRGELYKENKKILEAVNAQKSVNEREFGGIQTALEYITKSVDRMNGK